MLRFTTYDARNLKTTESAPYLRAAYQYRKDCGPNRDTVCTPYAAPAAIAPLTRYSYDTLGRLLTQTNPDKTKVEHHYGVVSGLKYDDVIDGNRHRKQYRHDVFGRLLQVDEISGDCSRGYWPEYACGGGFTTAWVPYATTRYTYDIFDHLTDVCDGKNNISVCGRTPDGSCTSDTCSDLHITYDAVGRKVGMKDPDMGTWSYGYDAAGNVKRQTDARNQRICSYYDELNRLKGKTYSTGSTACPADPGYPGYAVKFFYDESGYGSGVGRRTHTETTGSEATIVSFTYDLRGRVTRESSRISPFPASFPTATYSTIYEYHSNDQVKSVRYSPDGEVLTTTYNVQGLPSSLSTRLSGEADSEFYVKGATYNAAGQIKTLRLGNDFVTRYGYFGYNAFGMGDADDYPEPAGQPRSFGRLARICTAGNGICQSWSQMYQSLTSPLQDLTYGYDTGGNVTSIRDYPDENRIQFLSYDHLDRLKNALTRLGQGIPDPRGYDLTYDYDLDGNIIRQGPTAGSETLTYQDPLHKHAVTHRNGLQYYWYDPNGNMAARLNGSSTTLFEYDSENRLTRVSGNGPEVTFLYDADGRRVKRVEGSGTKAVTTLYLGKDHEKKIENGQVITTKYYSFNGKRVALSKGSSQTSYHYLFTDHLGSTSIAYDPATQSTSYQRYFPWGSHRATSAPVPTDREFTGQRYDASFGLYDYGARYYDPEIGRFIQPDTVIPDTANPQDWNRYTYVRNNPQKYVDPTGHFPLEGLIPPLSLPWMKVGQWIGQTVTSAINTLDSRKPHIPALFVEGTGGSISAPMGEDPTIPHYKPFQARNLQQFKPTPVDLLLNVTPSLALTAVWDAGAILQKYDLRGSQISAHSAGTWSAVLAGVLGRAKSVDVYGTPLALPYTGTVKVPLTGTEIHFHTRATDPAGYAAPWFNPLLYPLRPFSFWGMVGTAGASKLLYNSFGEGHNYGSNAVAPIP